MNYARKFIPLIFLVFLSFNLSGQCRLYGTVTDASDNSPVIGAEIFIHDIKIGAVTNLDGRYEMKNIPSGKYLVEIKAIGYTTLLVSIQLCNGEEHNFSLTESVVETREVLVTGASRATELRKMPAAVIMVDHNALLKSTSTNIIDALALKPGIAQVSSGPGISKPVIRGLGYNRIITLNDGIRQEGQQWGDEHGIEIDEFSADHAEVLKGPASLMYGSDAMAGVINIISAPPAASGTLGGSVIYNYQTNNGMHGISGMQNGNMNGVQWMLRGSIKNAGNYHNAYDGYVLNSGFREANVSGNIGLNRKWGFSHLIFSAFHQQPGLVEGERDSLTGKFLKPVILPGEIPGYAIAGESDLKSRKLLIPHQDIRHYKAGIDNTIILGKSRISVLLAAQRNSRIEYGNILNPAEEGLHFELLTGTADIKYYLPEFDNWQLTLGINASVQQNKNLGTEVLIPQYLQKDAGLFGYFKKDVNEKLSVSGGARYDVREYTGDLYMDTTTVRFAPLHRVFQNSSGSLGATYQASTAFSIKCNLARGYRAPQSAELSSNGLHEGTFRYETGNPMLRPETSIQADLGLLYSSDHFSSELSIFSNSIQHFIFLQKLVSMQGTDSLMEPNSSVAVYGFTQTNAWLRGAEYSFDLHPHPLDWLHFENSIAFVTGTMQTNYTAGKYLPFIPPLTINSELRADIKKTGIYFTNTYFRFSARYYAAQHHVLALNNTETPTPGYLLLDAGTGCDIKNKKGKIICTVVASVQNITDKAYQSHLSRLKYAPENYATGRTGVYNMGRNFSFKILVPLQFK